MIIRKGLLALLIPSVILSAGCGDDDDGGQALGKRSITVPLTYEGDSNFGSQTATGTATIETVSGKVTITVSGLEMLASDEYEGWLAGGGETALSTGKFNTDSSGAGGSDLTLGDLSARTFARVVLTVEPKPDPDPAPDPRHSIQGPIPKIVE